MGSLRWRDTEGGSNKTPAGEPSKPKYHGHKHEGQEVANWKNSRGRPKTFCEPALVALGCQTMQSEVEEGISPNETGMDYRKTLAEPGYLSGAVNKLQEISMETMETRGSHNWEEDWLEDVAEQCSISEQSKWKNLPQKKCGSM